MDSKPLSLRSDYIGIVSAVICLIHCIITPLFFSAYMHSHVHEGHGHVHSAGFNVDYIFLTIGLVAVWFSTKHADRTWIKVLLWASYLILFISVVFEATSPIFFWSLYAASVALIAAHVINLRHLRQHLRGEAHAH